MNTKNRSCCYTYLFITNATTMGIELLDNQKQETENNAPVLLTLGVFAYLMLSSVSYTTEYMLKDVLTYIESPKMLCVFLPKIAGLLVTIFLTLWISKYIKKTIPLGVLVLKQLLRNVVILFLCIRIVDYFYVFYRDEILPSNFIDKVDEVYLFQYGLGYYSEVSLVLTALTWLVIGGIFMRK